MNLLLKITAFILLGIYVFFLSCAKEYSCENCKGNNKPPIANAGHDQAIVLPKDSTILDGSNSTDPDGRIVSFSWAKISGPTSFNINSAASETTTVKNLVEGVYQFELEVTDNDGLSSKDTVMISVEKTSVNHPPVADAGDDQTIILPTNTVMLDGSGSWDPDNNITGYAWTKISGPSTVNISSPVNAQTKVTNVVKGVYQFELVVTDAGGLFSKDTVTITVKNPPGLPPIANAGEDFTVNYNLQSCSLEPATINLDGSASTDPDGTIVLYQWSLVSPNNVSVVITNPNSVITTVTLIPGNYVFRLQVTDNNGATDDDSVNITTTYVNRPFLNAQLIPIGTLSQTRQVSAVASVAGKIFFAGGTTPPTGPGPHYSSRVDIYDINTGAWSTAELSQARWGLTAVTSGDKVFFAGGTGFISQGRVGLSSRVDVYNSSTGLWTTMELPTAGQYSSTTAGGKVCFAGGNSVHVYDVNSNAWSTKNLSQPRYLMTQVNVRGQLYFAGGASGITGGIASSRIDIYDPSSGTLSPDDLNKPKYGMVGIGLRSGVLFAGGTTSNGMTNEVELAGNHFSCLFQPNSFSQYSMAESNNRFVFFVWDGVEKDKFDIYDATSNTWFIGKLNQAITPSLVISVDNTIYVVGAIGGGDGYYNQVWKLEF